jgi:LysM repeat protein
LAYRGRSSPSGEAKKLPFDEQRIMPGAALHRSLLNRRLPNPDLYIVKVSSGAKKSGDGPSAGGLSEHRTPMNTHTFTTGARRGLAAVALTGLGLGAAAGAANADTWDQLAQCESGGNWSINTGNGYQGGLQFSQSSWNAAGGTGSPAAASVEEQKRVATNLQGMQGWGAWPSCSAQLGLTGGSSTGFAAQQAPAPVQVQQVPVQVQAPVAQAPVQVQQVPVQVQQAPVQAPVAQAPVQVQAPVAAPVTLSGETYTIQSGDTLSSIADKLGVNGGWQALFAANADTVIHADLIFTGHVLQLPA